MRSSHLVRAAADVFTGLPLFLTAPLFRTWHMRWGATDPEVASPLPGDDLESSARHCATRALTIGTQARDVWPWIVQVGFGRAGFYSYDLLDGLGRASAETIIPNLQGPRVGDWIPMAAKVNETTAFRVHSFEPESWMLWQKPGSTWVWRLEQSGEGVTRLVTRLRWSYDWTRPALAATTVFLMEFGDFPMMRKMLLGIRRRAEALGARLAPSTF